VSERLKAHLLINLSCLFWAGNMTVGRALRDLVGGWTIVSARCLLSGLIFLLLLRILEPAGRAHGRSDFPKLLVMALTGIAGYQGALYFGLRFTDAINVSLIHAAAPLVTILMVWIWLGLAIRGAQLVGVLSSAAGIAVIITEGEWQRLGAVSLNPGDLLILLGITLFSVYNVVGRDVMQRRSVLSATAMATLLSALLLLPVGGWEVTQTQPVWGWGTALGLLYVTIFPGVLAFLAWNWSVKVVGPAEAMAFMNMIPLYVVLLATYLLGEPLQGFQVFGGTLIVGGCLAAALWARRA
jgi:drug/metabolite transporter (DMT)-like permease